MVSLCICLSPSLHPSFSPSPLSLTGAGLIMLLLGQRDVRVCVCVCVFVWLFSRWHHRSKMSFSGRRWLSSVFLFLFMSFLPFLCSLCILHCQKMLWQALLPLREPMQNKIDLSDRNDLLHCKYYIFMVCNHNFFFFCQINLDN